ncbi:unnamed protein product [Sympodiomycopsis kandeliae]
MSQQSQQPAEKSQTMSSSGSQPQIQAAAARGGGGRRRAPPNWADKTLGSFSNVPPSPLLDHLIRYLSTWSGTDKALMVTQYGSKLIIPLLTLQHAVRVRLAGNKNYHAHKGGSANARRLEKLSGLISDARMLYRIWGLLPMIKWMIDMERHTPPTRPLHMIERIQGWSMLIYCPMEAIAYLSAHSILPVSTKNQNRLWLWSCRCWAVYVGLQLLHLIEDNRLLRLRARALERSRGHPVPAVGGASGTVLSTGTTEKEGDDLSEDQAVTRRLWNDLDERKEAILGELWVNLGYLPLTIHWSTPNGILNSDAWVGLFGTIAAVAGIRPGWRATAGPRA